MNLYYTGATTYLYQQGNPEKSLGGFVSGTKIPNSLLDNLFTDVSLYAHENQVEEVRGIMLMNETSAPVVNLRVHMEYLNPSDKVANFELAVAPIINLNQIEKVSSRRSMPYNATFAEYTDPNNPLILTTPLAIGSMVGLWIKRIILPNPINSVPKADLENYLNTMVKNERVKIKFIWD